MKEQEKVIRELREKVRKLEAEAKAAPTKMAAAAVPDEKAITAAVEKRQAMLEKKWKKDKEDMEKVRTWPCVCVCMCACAADVGACMRVIAALCVAR